MKKGFTLIELLVAVGILAMMMSFASVIFRVSIGSQRTAAANAEIMQRFRAITDQLNRDFKGAILTRAGRLDVETLGGVKADRIVFFTEGDFQSIGQYKYTYRRSDGTIVEAFKTVSGNVACVFYGQAKDKFPDDDPNTNPFTGNPREKILVRRQTILTSDSSLLDVSSEFYKSSLSESNLDPNLDVDALIARPPLDSHSPEDLVMYMAKGVDNFTIEWFEGNIDSEGRLVWQRLLSGPSNISPVALKFTFTLYDSKGVIKNGRTFTHIVCLGD